MAYFHRKKAEDEEQYTRRFRSVDPADSEPEEEAFDDAESYDDAENYEDTDRYFYDDGMEELEWDDDSSDGNLPDEEPLPELTEEEMAEEKKRKFRIAANVGDLVAILAGTAVILVLAAFLFSMIQFVSTDLMQNFTIWATKF